MTKILSPVLLLLLAIGMTSPVCSAQLSDLDSKIRARDRLNAGVQAYKRGEYDQAIEDFRQAKTLDPSLLTARLYLATACATQFIPGALDEKNTRMAEQAVEEFKEVLDRDPNNLSAIDGIGAILYSVAGTPFDPVKFEESKSYHQKHILMKPDDPEPYYWVGAIDWGIAFHANKSLREEHNRLKPNKIKGSEPMPTALAAQFREQQGRVVDEGIENLTKAMELHPEYADAMAYLNLLYRQKAEMEPTEELREADVKTADDLVDQVKAIKKKKLERSDPQ
jgi:tetratricopeptide (TPR) repeat protein